MSCVSWLADGVQQKSTVQMVVSATAGISVLGRFPRKGSTSLSDGLGAGPAAPWALTFSPASVVPGTRVPRPFVSASQKDAQVGERILERAKWLFYTYRLLNNLPYQSSQYLLPLIPETFRDSGHKSLGFLLACLLADT